MNPPPPRNARDARQASAPAAAQPALSTEDKATASYVRRTLCAHHAIAVGAPQAVHELLPPLTSSNAVDLQVYAILAVILKEFVQAWYGKITPDHAFVDEVLLIIAHVTRGLEERIRKTDLQALLVDEIPQLLENHVSACRIAQQTVRNQKLEPKPAAIYHSLHPHPALHPVPDFAVLDTLVEQERNERAWRHMLVQGMLAVLLPTEDLQNGCLQSLVEEIIAEMILGNIVGNRLCQPWALWELIANAIRSARPQREGAGPEQSALTTRPVTDMPKSSKAQTGTSRLAQFGLVASDPAQQEHDDSSVSEKPVTSRNSSALAVISSIISFCLVAVNAMRWLLLQLLSSSRYPARVKNSSKTRAILSMKAWSMFALSIELPTRMPWLLGALSLAHTGAMSATGQLAVADGVLDRFLSRTIDEAVLDPARVPVILRSLRRTFFPANTFPRNSKPPPDAAAIAAIKQDCVQTILTSIPASARCTYFATSSVEAHAAAVERWLDLLGDAYMNKHVVFALLELCVVRLLPELAEQGPKELLAQRVGN